MKSGFVFVSALYGALLCGSTAGVAQGVPGQSSAGHVEPGAIDALPAASNAAISSLYSQGTRAINEGRWANAEAIFAMVAGQHGGLSDGALYWKAYAENKQDKRKPALATCSELTHAFPTSSWIHECGALEIEIHARTGKPVDPKTVTDDDLKLLALNSLMQKDESQALAQIQEILNTDSSEKLKQVRSSSWVNIIQMRPTLRSFASVMWRAMCALPEGMKKESLLTQRGRRQLPIYRSKRASAW
jgi:hypothetical protein